MLVQEARFDPGAPGSAGRVGLRGKSHPARAPAGGPAPLEKYALACGRRCNLQRKRRIAVGFSSFISPFQESQPVLIRFQELAQDHLIVIFRLLCICECAVDDGALQTRMLNLVDVFVEPFARGRHKVVVVHHSRFCEGILALLQIPALL